MSIPHDSLGPEKTNDQNQGEEDRDLLLFNKCDRICLFRCGCDKYECEGGLFGSRRRLESNADSTQQALGDLLGRHVNPENMSEKELLELEEEALAKYQAQNGDFDETDRDLFFLGRCTLQEDEVKDDFTVYVNPFDGRLVSFEYDGYEMTISGPNGKDIDIPITIEMKS